MNNYILYLRNIMIGGIGDLSIPIVISRPASAGSPLRSSLRMIGIHIRSICHDDAIFYRKFIQLLYGISIEEIAWSGRHMNK